MNASKSIKVLAAAVILTATALLAQTPPAAPAQTASSPRPIGLLDILAWKSAGGAAISPDGQWVAYRVSPQEGDGEVVIRQTRGTKEYKFPSGEGRMGSVAISEDGKFCAFAVFPSASQICRCRFPHKRGFGREDPGGS